MRKKDIDYHQNNKEKIKEKNKKRYYKNIIKIKEKNKEKFKCCCGVVMSKSSKYPHLKTQKHKDKMKQLEELDR